MEAVIFDMDGVIIDSEPLHFESDRRTLEEFGVDLHFEETKAYIGVPNRETYLFFKKKFNISAPLEELLEKQMVHKMHVFEEEVLSPMDGLLPLLAFLDQRRIKIGLASSSRRAFIETVLRRLHLEQHFAVVVSGEDVIRGKPDPDIFLKAAALLKCHPSECIVIEDSANGVKAGLAAQMFVYGMHNPNSGKQDLSGAHVQVGVLKEVQKHMDSILLDGYG